VTFFGDEMVMTSQKRGHNSIFEVRFRHNQLEKTQFGQSQNFRSPLLRV